MARYGYNYFAPTPPKQLRRQVARSVNAQIAPYLASINRRGAAGSALINQGTESLAASLAGAQGQAKQIYSDAEARQAAVDAALSQQLSGAGSSQSAALSAQLGQANIPTSNLLANIGSGAANAGAAMGSANIARLIAQGASQQEYAANLPNIARLGGQQQQSRYQGQLESQRQDILSKVPGLISTSTQQAQDREFQKSVASQSGLINQQKLNLDTAYKGARLKQSQQSLDQRAQQNQINNLYKAAGLKVSQGHLALAAQREQRLQRGKAGKTKNAFTPSQISKFRSTAIDTVKDWKHGVPGTTYADGSVKSAGLKGKPGAQGARSAFRYLVNHGIPPSMADWAVGQVYGKWKVPGQRSKRGATGTGPR